MKKILLLFTLLCSFFTFSTLKAETRIVLDIETSNVIQDLKYLYGGEDYKKFNIVSLYPNENKDKNLNFKFLCAKPIQDDLYLYLYNYVDVNNNINKITFDVSLSKEQLDNGLFNESFKTYESVILNTYGTTKKFIKVKINDIVNKNDDTRIYIKKCNISYTKSYPSILSYEINDEMFFSPTENGNFVYQYFKDDYVKITDGQVVMQLTGKKRVNGLTTGDKYSSFNEDFYYFFTTDKRIEDLVEIQYDYELLTYDVEHTFPKKFFDIYKNNNKSGIAYQGHYQNDETSKDFYQFTDASRWFNEKVETRVNNVIKQNTYTETVEQPKFLWWNRKISYNVTNIQNCLNTDNLDGVQNQSFKSLIKIVNDERIKSNKEEFQWVFRVHSDVREVYKAEKLKRYGIVTWAIQCETKAHEVKQTMITWLKFRTDNQTFELNAFDIPKDTIQKGYRGNLPEWKLFDESDDDSLFDNAIEILTKILMIIGLFAILPIIRGITKFIGKKIENKSIKKKKTKGRKK